MTPELESLGRRAIACKGWRWLPGMLAYHPNWRAGRVSHVGLTAVRVACRYPSPMGGTAWAVPPLPITGLLPDLSDPATLGCQLALVREAIGCPEAHVYYNPHRLSSRWVVRWGHEWVQGIRTVDANTEAEALVAALETAP